MHLVVRGCIESNLRVSGRSGYSGQPLSGLELGNCITSNCVLMKAKSYILQLQQTDGCRSMIGTDKTLE